MNHLQLFEKFDRDLTDTGNSWITSDRNTYEKAKKWYGIDGEEIVNIFQEILDIYPNLVMDIMIYHNRNGFNVYFYDFKRVQKIKKYDYPIDEELLEEIYDRLNDYGIKGRLEYDQYGRYFYFDLRKI